ncbi:hypothetical protein Lser_V15G05130 [Lactuca serriola]
MSEYVAFEIQAEIMKRLPVKSLVRFRSVSKPWKFLIDSSEFISGYRVHQPDPQHLLVWYKDPVDTNEKYVTFVDDEAFAQQELAPAVPVLSKFLNDLKTVGSSQGLLCFYGYYQDPSHPRFEFATEMAVLWNPSIRKSICVTVPGESLWSKFVLGFGVCPITNDPTIVKITNVDAYSTTDDDSSPMVEVFTLSRGSWRIPSNNLPKKSIQVTWSQVVIDNFIYWAAFDQYLDDDDDGQIQKNLIVSFDMTTHEFKVINLPKSLAYHGFVRVAQSVSKVRDSLAVLEYITYTDSQSESELQVCDVWIMDHSIPHMFTKLFTIEKECDSIKILGFTKRGEAMMETQDVYEEPASLVVYEPNSKYFNDTGINGERGALFVSLYMETLLLLDQSDCSVL